MGAKHLGMSTSLMVDQNRLACETLLCNGEHVLQGDIQCPAVQRAIHDRVAQDPGLLTAGFPCQPFSVQGCGLGLRDCRGSVLAAVLHLAWRIQPAGVVLECVAAVSEHPDVGGLVRQLATFAGFQVQEVHLELSSQWPARHNRWWCVLLFGQGPALRLLPWPTDSTYGAVKTVIPEWPIWRTAEEDALKWTALESEKFLDPRYGTDSRQLNVNGPAPTALHSLGSPLAPCPCGCRGHFQKQPCCTGPLRLWSSKSGWQHAAHPPTGGMPVEHDPSHLQVPRNCQGSALPDWPTCRPSSSGLGDVASSELGRRQIRLRRSCHSNASGPGVQAGLAGTTC